MSGRYWIAFVVGLSAVVGFAQRPPAAPDASGLTDYPVFRFFFKHVVKTESYADELLRLGKDDSSERHRFKSAAGLTDAEESLLKATAKDADGAIADFDKATAAIASQLRAQSPTGPPTPAALLELQSRAALRQQIVQKYIGVLRASMPADRFQRLYNFVWSTESPRIKVAQPSAAPPANVPPPSAKQ
jgi:hypothetical protein